mmetsp:Transcript_13267/g.13065  ORF Transcript_13267/g.13065 Transcript_13267/m.13065 type:complete len:87 (+) Transcript_13267:501-761(+)
MGPAVVMNNTLFSSDILGVANAVCAFTATLLSALLNYLIGALIDRNGGGEDPVIIGKVAGSFLGSITLISSIFLFIAAHKFEAHLN